MATTSGVSTKEAIAEINALIAAFNKLSDETKNISTNSKKGLKELAENTSQLKTQATLAEQKLAALNARVQANSRGANSYAKQMDLLRRRTDEVSKAADRQAKELSKLEKEASKSGNALTRLGGGFRALLGAYGIATGIQLFAQFTVEVFRTVKSFESLGLAMNQIAGDSIALASSQAFLNSLVKDFGVEIISTSRAWIKFLSASKQSGVTLRDTEGIFRSITKAGAVLGLTVDEMNGVFLALEQMMSKGKVTTEELRRQLGERMPGAVGIMAAALGVGTQELDKMLKKGEVLSADALPKFARALEAAYGIEHVENIDNLTAAQGRLTTAWKVFQNEVFASKGWTTVTNAIAETIAGITLMFSDFDYQIKFKTEKSVEEWSKVYKNQATAVYDFQAEEGEKYAQLVADREAKTAKIKYEKSIGTSQDVIDILEKELKVTTDLILKANKFIEDRQQENARARIENALKLLKVSKEQYELELKNEEQGSTATAKIKQRLDAYAVSLANVIVLRKLAEVGNPVVPTNTEDDDEGTKKKPSYYDLKDIENFENKVRIAMLQMQKEKNDALLKADVLFAEETVAILNDNTAIELELAKIKYNEELRINKKFLEDRLNDTKEAVKDGKILTFNAKEEEALLNKQLDDKNKIALQAYEKEILKIKVNARLEFNNKQEEILDEEIERIEGHYDREVAVIKKAYNEGARTREDKEAMDQALFELQYKRLNDIIDLQIQYNKALLEAGDLTEAEIEKIEKTIAALEASRPVLKDIEKSAKSLEEKYQDLVEVLELVNEGIQATAMLASAIFERRIQEIEEEIQAEKNKYDALIDLAENNNDEQVRLRKERDLKIAALEKKQAKERRKQAIVEKVAAVSAAVTNTAIAITGALLPGRQWMIPIIAAIGALQVAAIIAAPIPKYKKGLKKAKTDHVAQINDGGQQEYLERDGSILTTTQKDAIVQIKKGDVVHKSYEAMMAARQVKSIGLSSTKVIVKNENEGLKADIIDGIKTGFKKVRIHASIKYDADWSKYKQNTL
jgi:tape measure domain-containing protein